MTKFYSNLALASLFLVLGCKKEVSKSTILENQDVEKNDEKEEVEKDIKVNLMDHSVTPKFIRLNLSLVR